MDLYERCIAAYRESGLLLATAESLTGGLIAARLTDVPGASAVLRGGVVSYTNEVKNAVLGVPQALLDEHGPVSEPVARAMAEGARRACLADVAVAVTGVAGPARDERENPVGTVYIAAATEKGTVCALHRFGEDKTRAAIRSLTADAAVALALEQLPR